MLPCFWLCVREGGGEGVLSLIIICLFVSEYLKKIPEKVNTFRDDSWHKSNETQEGYGRVPPNYQMG